MDALLRNKVCSYFGPQIDSTSNSNNEHRTNIHDEGYISLLGPHTAQTHDIRGLEDDSNQRPFREFKTTSHFTSSVVQSEVMSINQTFLTNQENETELSMSNGTTYNVGDSGNRYGEERKIVDRIGARYSCTNFWHNLCGKSGVWGTEIS